MEESKRVRNMGVFLLVCSSILLFLGFGCVGMIASEGAGLHSFFNILTTFLFVMFFPVSCFVASIGLLSLKGWGRFLTIANSLIASICFSFWVILDCRDFLNKELGGFIVLAFCVVIIGLPTKFIYYLTRPKVKELFKKS